MSEQPTVPGPEITAVSFEVRYLGFVLNVVREGAQWALQGAAVVLASQLVPYGGAPLQDFRWATAEEAEAAAVKVLGAGAQFAAAVASVAPQRG